MLNNGIIRQSTPVTLLIGPFLDGDGTTVQDGLTLSQADIEVSKEGSSPAPKNEPSGATSVGDGLYTIEIDQYDTDTPGYLAVIAYVNGTIYVRHSYQVMEEAVFDALYAPGASGWPSTGLGARTAVVTVDDGSSPLQNAQVRLQNGPEIYILTTNALGQVTYNLDDATWSVAITKPGYSFDEVALVVDGDINPTYSMTP